MSNQLNMAEMLDLTNADLLKLLETQTIEELTVFLNGRLAVILEKMHLKHLRLIAKSFGFRQKNSSKPVLLSYIEAEYDTRILHTLTTLQATGRSSVRKGHLQTSTTLTDETFKGDQNNLATITQQSNLQSGICISADQMPHFDSHRMTCRPASTKRKNENTDPQDPAMSTLNEIMERLREMQEMQITLLKNQDQLKNDIVAIKESLQMLKNNG